MAFDRCVGPHGAHAFVLGLVGSVVLKQSVVLLNVVDVLKNEVDYFAAASVYEALTIVDRAGPRPVLVLAMRTAQESFTAISNPTI